jgi:hypothetical protein
VAPKRTAGSVPNPCPEMVTGDPIAAEGGDTDTMIGPRNTVVVGATVGLVRTVVLGLVDVVAAVSVGAVGSVVDVVDAVLVDAEVAGTVGVVGAGAGAVGNSNGVAVSCTAVGVQPVTTTVPPIAAALDDAGQASHATPPATSAVTTPMPTIVLRCSSPSPSRGAGQRTIAFASGRRVRVVRIRPEKQHGPGDRSRPGPVVAGTDGSGLALARTAVVVGGTGD